MKVKPISKEEFNLFLKEYPPLGGLFLQTPDWLDFIKSNGGQGELVGIYSEKVLGVAVVEVRVMRGGFKYVYIARGPLVLEGFEHEALVALAEYFKTRGIFIKIEPGFVFTGEGFSGFKAGRGIQPLATSVVNLNVREDELLKSMHSKTRYNINLSLKKDLSWALTGVESWSEVWPVFEETAIRDGFSLHVAGHYKKMLSMFGSKPLGDGLAMRLALVKNSDRLLAASILVFYKDYVTYLHGASANGSRELMPTYLLHWQSMMEAKKLGYKFYDLGGVASTIHPNSKWEGVTRFKSGWGGQLVDFSGSWDYPYNKAWYALYQFALKILK